MQRKIVIYEENQLGNKRAGVVTINSGDSGLVSWMIVTVTNEIKRANLRPDPKSTFSFNLSKLKSGRKRRAK